MIGQRLMLLRADAELSARELDRLAGLGEGHVSMIETGRRPNIESATAVKIAAVFNVSLDWLLIGKGDKPAQRSVRAAVERAKQTAWAAEQG